jgi:hypothetical protein
VTEIDRNAVVRALLKNLARRRDPSIIEVGEKLGFWNGHRDDDHVYILLDVERLEDAAASFGVISPECRTRLIDICVKKRRYGVLLDIVAHNDSVEDVWKQLIDTQWNSSSEKIERGLRRKNVDKAQLARYALEKNKPHIALFIARYIDDDESREAIVAALHTEALKSGDIGIASQCLELSGCKLPYHETLRLAIAQGLCGTVVRIAMLYSRELTPTDMRRTILNCTKRKVSETEYEGALCMIEELSPLPAPVIDALARAAFKWKAYSYAIEVARHGSSQTTKEFLRNECLRLCLTAQDVSNACGLSGKPLTRGEIGLLIYYWVEKDLDQALQYARRGAPISAIELVISHSIQEGMVAVALEAAALRGDTLHTSEIITLSNRVAIKL